MHTGYPCAHSDWETAMKSGSVVGSMVEDTLSDTNGNLLEGRTLTRFGSAAQGSAMSARGSMKSHHRTQEHRRVGGTNNDIKAMFGMDGRKLCKVVKRELDEHVWKNGVMVRTDTRPEVLHTVVVTPDSIPTSTIIMRAERKDMTPIQWCVFVGYTPNDAQFAELIAVS